MKIILKTILLFLMVSVGYTAVTPTVVYLPTKTRTLTQTPTRTETPMPPVVRIEPHETPIPVVGNISVSIGGVEVVLSPVLDVYIRSTPTFTGTWEPTNTPTATITPTIHVDASIIGPVATAINETLNVIKAIATEGILIQGAP